MARTSDLHSEGHGFKSRTLHFNVKKLCSLTYFLILDDIYINVMAQYFPTYKAKEDELINRKLTKREYRQIEEYFYSLDFKNGYMQELGEHEEEYVPKWDN